jgi:hypothetical protein
MDIHKPKPMHGLREFLSEIGVVVLGVLIALGAEQGVDALHWQHKIHQAVEAMRLELRDDDGPQGFVRIAVEPCFSAQLDGIQAAVESGKGRQEIGRLAAAYRPPFRTWDSDAWKSVISSDFGAHVSAEQMSDWSKPYRTLGDLAAVNAQERGDLMSLRPTRAASGHLTPPQEEVVLAAIQRLREDNRTMALLSRKQFFGLETYHMGVPNGPAQHVLNGLRGRYGACVAVPSAVGVNPDEQLNDFR